MAEKNNAVCSICGKEYYACLSCSDAMKLHPWKSFTDTAEHFKVFQVVRGLSTGVYAKDEAKEKFKNIDLKDIESFRPHIKKIIKDVLNEDMVVVDATKKIENTVVEDVIVENVSEIAEVKVEETETVKNVIKPAVSRKRNYKMEA